MAVGESMALPREKENGIRVCARAAGINIVQRRLGTKDKVYIWRVF